jgi:hypothetical protein
MKSTGNVWLALAAPVTLAAQFTTQLAPQTREAFEDYRKSAESAMDWRARSAGAVRAGEINIAPGGRNSSTEVSGGMIHDWIASTLATGATAEKAVALLQDYVNYKIVYDPEVVDSRLLGRDGNVWHVYLKLMKKKILTAVLNSEYDVEYRPLGDGRWAVISRSTKITEIDNGRELAPGTGTGFLWNLNAYWLIEPRPEGVYLECRTISLTRDIPAGLGWMIRPMVSSLPRDSLRATLEATVRRLR